MDINLRTEYRHSPDATHACSLCGTDLADVAEIVEAHDGDACIECARDAGLTCTRCAHTVESSGLCESCLADDDARAESAAAALLRERAATLARIARSQEFIRLWNRVATSDGRQSDDLDASTRGTLYTTDARVLSRWARMERAGLIERVGLHGFRATRLGRELNTWKRTPIAQPAQSAQVAS